MTVYLVLGIGIWFPGDLFLYRFLIIASDGVFEFLTNQSVADMVARYPDPLDACKKVVQEAYDLWLQYEVRTDDITIICVYVGEL